MLPEEIKCHESISAGSYKPEPDFLQYDSKRKFFHGLPCLFLFYIGIAKLIATAAPEKKAVIT